MSRSLSIVAFVLLRSGQQHLVLSKQTQSGNDAKDVKSLVVHDKQSQSAADAEEFRKVAGSAVLFFEDMLHATHNGMSKEQLLKVIKDGSVVMDKLTKLESVLGSETSTGNLYTFIGCRHGDSDLKLE
ncbi:hypothetical protein ABG067_000627 [Albugo candida]